VVLEHRGDGFLQFQAKRQHPAQEEVFGGPINGVNRLRRDVEKELEKFEA